MADAREIWLVGLVTVVMLWQRQAGQFFAARRQRQPPRHAERRVPARAASARATGAAIAPPVSAISFAGTP